MASLQEIAVEDIVLDEENPRLAEEGNLSQKSLPLGLASARISALQPTWQRVASAPWNSLGSFLTLLCGNVLSLWMETVV